MRDIKYRAFWKEMRKMVEVHSLNSDGEIGFFINVRYSKLKELYVLDLPTQYELMQYTGLKDMDGVEIYEGDIIEAVNFVHKPKTVVKWSDKATGYVPFIEQNFDLDYTNLSYWHDLSRNRVIGNIYENTELMEDINFY